MKKFAITTAVVLLGLAPAATADESAPATNAANTCCTESGNCKAPCTKSDKGACNDEKAWLDIETVTVEAENGNPIAQYTVAYLYETGNDTTAPDSTKASDWYTKALPGLEKSAADGNPAACRALARMYAEGKGVEKNHETAEKYWKMYKECKKKESRKECCPDSAPPATPAAN